MRPLRVLLLHAASDENATLSYQHGWPRHFRRHPGFQCTSVNLRGAFAGRLAGLARARWQSFDAIILLHSVFSNACALVGPLREAVRQAPGLKAYFLGNEYKLMPEKMAMSEEIGVDLLVSQSDSPRVQALYRERLGCRVVGIPNTGLDTELFFPRKPRSERPIDLGYRALDAPLYLGHDERRRIAEEFRAAADRHRLRLDVSLRAEDRLDEPRWARFLNECKGQLGTEAGGDYFELTDETRHAVNEYQRAHPAAGLDEIRPRFFAPRADPVAMRILSGRNVEAAGTKTVQLLLEGHYGGYLQPDVHYIPIRKDFSNVDEVVAKFRDEAWCARLTENAHRVAVEQLTYRNLIDRFRDALRALL